MTKAKVASIFYEISWNVRIPINDLTNEHRNKIVIIPFMLEG